MESHFTLKKIHPVSVIIIALALCISLTFLLVTFSPADVSAADVPQGTASVWDGTSSDTSWYNNTDIVFTITSAAQLKGFANLVNGGINFAGKTLKLDTDIDLNNLAWTPIENFAGTFDGQNHTISKLNVTKNHTGAGFFGAGNENDDAIWIANTIFDNCIVNSSDWGTGIIIGVTNSRFTRITNCTVMNSTVNSISWAGTITGVANKGILIKDCAVSNCTIAPPSEDGSSYDGYGGIIGVVRYNTTGVSKIENCSVIDTVITNTPATQNDVGIFIGSEGDQSGAALDIDNCYTNMFSNMTELPLVTVGQARFTTINGMQYGVDQILLGEVDIINDITIKNGVAYSISNENATSLQMHFPESISEIAVNVNNIAAEYTYENDTLLIGLNAGYNVININGKIGASNVSYNIISGFSFVPNTEILIDDASILENAALIYHKDNSYYLNQNTYSLKLSCDSILDGVVVNAAVGGTVYNAENNIIDLGTISSDTEVTLSATYDGHTYNSVLTFALLLPTGVENVYYLTECVDTSTNEKIADKGWIVDSGITDSIAFKSGNAGTDSSASIMSLYVFNSSSLSFKYAESGEALSDGRMFDFFRISTSDGVFDYAKDPVATADLAWQDYSTFFAADLFTMSVQFIKDSSAGGGEDCAWIKDISTSPAGTSEDNYVNLTVNYDDGLGTVTNIKNYQYSVIENGVSYRVLKGTSFELLASPLVGGVESSIFPGKATYSIFDKFSDGTSDIKSSIYTFVVGADTVLSCDFIEALVAPSSTIAKKIVNDVSTDVNVTDGDTITLSNANQNTLIACAPVLNIGEKCSLVINGTTISDDLPSDAGYYYYLISDIQDIIRADIIFTYKVSGYVDASLTYTVIGGTIEELLIKPASLPITIINDETYPYTFDKDYSSAERKAFSAGNRAIDSSISNIGFTVTGSGVLMLDAFIGTEGGWDVVLYSVNTPCTDDTNKYFDGGNYSDKSAASGNIGWKSYTIAVAAATPETTTTIYLAYKKDGSTGSNGDTFAVANVAFFTGNATINYAVSDVTAGTVTATANGTAFNSGDELICGTDVVLTAAVNEGYHFYGWADESFNLISTELTVQFSVIDTHTYTAIINEPHIYKARVNGAFFTSLSDALDAVVGGNTIFLLENTELNEDAIIPADVTLRLPYNDKNDTQIGTETTASSRVSWTNESAYLNKTLTINSGVTLTVNGALIVGGVQHYPDQSAQGHTSGTYNQIINNGSIVLNGTMTVYGLVKGTGRLTANDGATLKQPFMVNNYSGGTNTEALYNAGQFPFVQFDTVNIQCGQTINYGAKVIGMTSLYFWGGVTTQDVVLVNKIENQGTEGSLIWMHSGSSLDIAYDGTKRVNGAVENINLADSGLNTITISGQITAGEFYLNVLGGYGSNNMVLAVPYTYNFVINNGAVVNIPVGRAYKIMPGAKVTVNDGGTLNVNGKLYVYDGLIQAAKSGKSYPNSAILKANGFSQSGMLVVNGTMNINGTFAGIVQTGGTTGTIVTAAAAVLTATVTDGCYAGWKPDSEEYTGQSDNTTVFNLTARAFGLNDNATGALAAGKIYVAITPSAYQLASFSVTSAAHMSYTTETINQAMLGGFAEKVGETEYKVNRTFYIGEAVSGVQVHMDGTLCETDAAGKFIAAVTFGTDMKVDYYTKDKDGTKRHSATVTFGSDYDTLTEVVKSAALAESNVYERVYNANGTVATDFALNSVVTFYGGSTVTVPLAFTDDTTKYVLNASLTNADYTAANCTHTLKTKAASFAVYVAGCTALSGKTSTELVAYATTLYASYGAILEGRTSDEITWAKACLDSNNGYASAIVKSAAVTGTVTYGDASASATLTYVDGSTNTNGTVASVSYALNNSVISGSFTYDGTYQSIPYSVTTSVNNVNQKHLDVTIDNKTSVYGDELVDLTYTTTDSVVTGDNFGDVVGLVKDDGTNVGIYEITGECKDARYSISFTPGEYVITARKIELTVENHNDVMLSKTNNISFTVTQTNSGAASGITFEIKKDGSLVATVDAAGAVTLAEGQEFAVGTYQVLAVNHDGNYEIISNTAGTLDVVEDNDYYLVEVSYGKTNNSAYDGTAISVSATVKVKETLAVVTGYTVSITLGGKAVDQIKGAGTYTVTVNITADDIDYPETFTVDTREVDIRWTKPDFTYNGSNQKPSFTLDKVVDGDTVTGVYGTFDCKDAGNHTATITSLGGADGANYKLPAAIKCSYDFNIAAYAIDVTIDDKESVYGDVLDENLCEISCTTQDTLIGSDILKNIVRLTKAPGLTVKEGGYAITGVCTNSNYDITFTDGVYTVTPRELKVAIDNKTSVYGNAFAALTAQLITGTLVSDDELYDIVNLTKAAGSIVKEGGYAITGVCTNSNYDIAFTDGTYTITPRTVKIAIGDATSVYGDVDSAIPTSVKEGSFGFDDTVDDILDVARVSGSGVNTYAITATKLENANYNVTVVYTDVTKSNYTVTKRPVTITIENATLDNTATWADLVQKLKYDVTAGNVVGSDNLNVSVFVQFDANTVLSEGNFATHFAGGEYDIKASYDNGNYEVSFVTGTLTVGKRLVGVSVTELVFTYTGEVISVFDWAENVTGYLPSATASSFKCSFTKNGQAIDSVVGAGTYRMTIEIVHTHAYGFAANAVTEYEITVNKKDISSSISAIGCTDNGIVVLKNNLAFNATSGNYDCVLNKALFKVVSDTQNDSVDTIDAAGNYLFKVEVEDDNYCGEASYRFKVVNDVAPKAAALSTKLAEYVGAEDGAAKTSKLFEIRKHLATFDEDDLYQMNDNLEYAAVLEEFDEYWTDYVSAQSVDVSTAKKAASAAFPLTALAAATAFTAMLAFACKRLFF